MDEFLRYERSAFVRYWDQLESGEIYDLALRRELAVREHGELLQRVLDDHQFSAADPVRLEAARLTAARRRLLERISRDVVDEESG